jgi:hypothetical protein
MATTTHTETNSDLWTVSTVVIMVFLSMLVSPLVLAIVGSFVELSAAVMLTTFGATVFAMALGHLGIQVARG